MKLLYAIVDKDNKIRYTSENEDNVRKLAHQLNMSNNVKKIYICELTEELKSIC